MSRDWGIFTLTLCRLALQHFYSRCHQLVHFFTETLEAKFVSFLYLLKSRGHGCDETELCCKQHNLCGQLRGPEGRKRGGKRWCGLVLKDKWRRGSDKLGTECGVKGREERRYDTLHTTSAGNNLVGRKDSVQEEWNGQLPNNTCTVIGYCAMYLVDI